ECSAIVARSQERSVAGCAPARPCRAFPAAKHVRVSATSAAPVISPPVPRATRLAPVITRHVALWWPWLAGLATLVAAMHAIEPLPVGVFYDDAQYLVLAKSLASGNGYR